jgi:hypothetical protein
MRCSIFAAVATAAAAGTKAALTGEYFVLLNESVYQWLCSNHWILQIPGVYVCVHMLVTRRSGPADSGSNQRQPPRLSLHPLSGPVACSAEDSVETPDSTVHSYRPESVKASL